MACSHPENRMTLTCMEEWPEWILEVLISNYEVIFHLPKMESFLVIVVIKKCIQMEADSVPISVTNIQIWW